MLMLFHEKECQSHGFLYLEVMFHFLLYLKSEHKFSSKWRSDAWNAGSF